MTARARSVAALVGLFFAAACSSGSGGEVTAFDVSPLTQPFVGDLVETLDASCGSLDCHGKIERNLELYGLWGLRASTSDIPGCQKTTPAEQAADYWSLVGLEPELSAAVFADGGAHPERLTVVRKARGAEDHAGGAVFAPGSAGDLCLTSFFSSHIDDASCNNALPAVIGTRCSVPADSEAP